MIRDQDEVPVRQHHEIMVASDHREVVAGRGQRPVQVLRVHLPHHITRQVYLLKQHIRAVLRYEV